MICQLYPFYHPLVVDWQDLCSCRLQSSAICFHVTSMLDHVQSTSPFFMETFGGGYQILVPSMPSPSCLNTLFAGKRLCRFVMLVGPAEMWHPTIILRVCSKSSQPGHPNAGCTAFYIYHHLLLSPKLAIFQRDLVLDFHGGFCCRLKRRW